MSDVLTFHVLQDYSRFHRPILNSSSSEKWYSKLTHWGWVTHICVGKLTIIGSDNGLSPSRHQAIIRTNAGILLIGTLGTNFSEILSEIHTFSFKKMHLKMSSERWRQFCLGLNGLTEWDSVTMFYSSRQETPKYVWRIYTSKLQPYLAGVT